MATTLNELTRLICLFHHPDQAQAAMRDLEQAGVSPHSITIARGEGSPTGETLEELGIPERDLAHLREGLRDGGTILAVAANNDDEAERIEDIFGKHHASKIDELDTKSATPIAEALPLAGAAAYTGAAATGASAERTIPIVEEDMLVGKREVDRGGVRVYRRVLEIPVHEDVALREEHVVVERHPVDRAVTDADLTLTGERTIELVETAEEAVVAKRSRVVEEVVVGKVESERTEHIEDTVRRTEVEVEEVLPTTDPVNTTRQTY